MEKINSCDLIIGVFDSINFDEEDKEILKMLKDKNNIICINKKDLEINKKNINGDYIYISAINKDIDDLKKAILIKLGLLNESFDLPSISNTRELGLLKSVNKMIKDTLKEVDNDISIDLISSSIQSIYLKILEITGEDHDFDIAKEIFSRFCVGK